jgi:hypothetical protein
MSRIPTLKLTQAEWLALALAVVKDIGEQPVRDVMMEVLGGERYNRLVVEKQSTRTTKAENHAMIRGIYPFIPGKTRAEKEAYLIALGAKVFKDKARFADVLAYVKSRVTEHEDAGGTIDELPPKDAHIVDLVSQWFGGVRMSGATLDPAYVLTVSRDGRSWSAMPSDWTASSGMLLEAICAAAYQRPDGTWVGGKYEWLPKPPRTRGWGNIRNGYGGWVPPPPGTEMLVWAYTAVGHRVSNVCKCVWG